MAIYVSASSLNDFISCSQKVNYRLFGKEKEVPSKEARIGSITHKVIEQKWNDLNQALELANTLSRQEGLDSLSNNMIESFVHTYFENFKQHLSEKDLIEHKFKIKIDKDVFLVGVMDRVSNGNVFDWKTSKTTPTRLDNNVQFIIYNMAYNRVFNSSPAGLYLASLREGKMVRYVESKLHTDILLNNIIPDFINTVRKKDFIKTGVFNGSCYYCPYRKSCLSEGEEDVMVHTKFIER